MENLQPWTFTCKTCGGHDLTVTRIWSILAGTDSESWQEWGPLEAGHLWHYDYKEKIEKPREQMKPSWEISASSQKMIPILNPRSTKRLNSRVTQKVTSSTSIARTVTARSNLDGQNLISKDSFCLLKLQTSNRLTVGQTRNM